MSRRRLAAAALVVAASSAVLAPAALASGAWPPNPPAPKATAHIVCWRVGDGFCWIPWVW